MGVRFSDLDFRDLGSRASGYSSIKLFEWGVGFCSGFRGFKGLFARFRVWGTGSYDSSKCTRHRTLFQAKVKPEFPRSNPEVPNAGL